MVPGEDVHDMINAVYDDPTRLGDSGYLKERSVLAPTNEAVDRVNDIMMARLPGQVLASHALTFAEVLASRLECILCTLPGISLALTCFSHPSPPLRLPCMPETSQPVCRHVHTEALMMSSMTPPTASSPAKNTSTACA